MGGVDKARVARVVEKLSAGSKYHANALARDARLAEKAARIKAELRALPASALAAFERELAAAAALAEARRDLTRIVCVVDMDAFVHVAPTERTFWVPAREHEPVRELAGQVEEQFLKYGGEAGIRSLLIHGGVGYGKQREGLEAGVDVLIATPGRLLDLMQQRAIDLRYLEVLVLDEVDRMLDMGFMPDVRRIVQQCPEKRQTLFFSATIPPEIASLAAFALKEPFKIEVGRPRGAATTVSHYFYPVNRLQREELFLALLKETDFKSVMVFTKTKADADMLAARVKTQGEYKVALMHGDIAQKDRTKALAGFRTGEFDVIIATDVAARGLDVTGVTHVINYSVPDSPEDYVHRIGRTGRAEKEGDAFTILSADELPAAQAVERLIGQTVERRRLPGEFLGCVRP